MTVNFKTLNSFVKAVDAGSLSAAAALLHIAQPALSQQIGLLETHFRRKLLIRSNVGVIPTDAGRELYRHAVLMLKQLEQAEFDVPRTDNLVTGNVSVGMATYSSTSMLATPLLKRVRQDYPHVNLFINDNFGIVLSELVLSGQIDMAVIYGTPATKGLKVQPLLIEELFLIAPPGTDPAGSTEHIGLAQLGDTDLLLPGRMHYLRQLIDKAFAQVKVKPRVTAEIDSLATLREAIEAGLGATILPWAVAKTFAGPTPPVIRRVVEPTLQVSVSLCIPEHRQMSDSALSVAEILAELVRELAASGQSHGVREAGALAAR